ncbi:fatty acid--CoA ligase [Anaeromyxobacter oryzae]|uniref:AMP-binding protein n=1 Tax=Anaeromyxobacter oryzae TaxID=2918170 RepID=A0ABN6MLP1_9BACT|nr:fatty acid--CoA ligase [Anaeromyxobacter oryzae]BDG01954.1 AMP-binding protein [Anaeromyxobacter oryzae]
MLNDTAPSAPARRDGLTIRRLLESPVARDPAQEIVYRDLRRHTYADLEQRIHRLAGALAALGVKPGDTVGVMDWDSHRYLEAFFAVPMMGAVLHTINVRLSPEQILYTIEHAGDDVLLVHSDFLPVLETIRGRIDTVRAFVVLTDDGAPGSHTVRFAGEYEALLAAAPERFPFPELDEDTRATTFYTTGTTGLPKGVWFTHRQLVLHTLGTLATLATAHHASFRRGDVYMPITPMFHVHAWGLPYIATALGVKQVYPGRYAPDVLLGLIAREGVTFSHCVPTILHMLLRTPGGEAVDLSRWKVLVGGAALPKPLALAALARGIDVVVGYGMSETCPVLTIAHLDPADLAGPAEAQAELRTRTGRALPLVDLRVVGDELAELPADGRATGEIVVRAPWLTAGYLKEEKASEKLWEGGVLHTGDVAWRDARGYVKIVDRRKDVIKVGGEWVSSLELEDVLAAHPAVAEVAVIGRPDPKWGERPLALVVARAGDPAPDERTLHAHVKGYVEKGVLGRQALLLEVKGVDAIDRTSVGKVNKRALREKHL